MVWCAVVPETWAIRSICPGPNAVQGKSGCFFRYTSRDQRDTGKTKWKRQNVRFVVLFQIAQFESVPFSTFSHSHSHPHTHSHAHTHSFTITSTFTLTTTHSLNSFNAFNVNELDSKYILHALHSTTLHTQHTQHTQIQHNIATTHRTILTINRPTSSPPSLGMRGSYFAPSWPRTAPWLCNYFHTLAILSLFSILLTTSTIAAQPPSNRATTSSSFSPMPTLDPHLSVSNVTDVPSIWRNCTPNQRRFRVSLITHGKKYFDRSRNTYTPTHPHSHKHTHEDTPHEALMVPM